MKTLDILKSRLIDRIMVAKNQELLEAIEGILNSTEKDSRLPLDSLQIEILMMSEADIENGDLISEIDLLKEDSEWMG